MVNPVYNNAVGRAGGMEQSIAASGSMILNQVDRELIKERVGDTPRSGAFISQIKGLLTKLTKVDDASAMNRGTQKSKGDKDVEALENQLKLQRRMFRISGGVPQERVEIFAEERGGNARPDTLGETEGINLETLKKYAVAFAHQLIKKPSAKIRLDAYTHSLQKDIPDEIRKKIEITVGETLFDQLAKRIREILVANLSDPIALLRLLIKVKRPSRVLSLVVSVRAQKEGEDQESPNPLSALFETFGTPKKQFALHELTLLARNLGVDLRDVLEKWKIDKVSIRSLTTIDLSDEEKDSVVEKPELFALYRNAWIAYWLEVSAIKRVGGNLQLKRLRADLIRHGAQSTELEAMENDARKLAWVHCVTQLKELHLKRVFSGTEREFQKISQVITVLTRRARHLGRPISPDGLKWVEAKLEVMALQSAQYKLNMLQSMQKLSFDKGRERDMQWLTKTIEVLKKRLPSQKQIEEANLAFA